MSSEIPFGPYIIIATIIFIFFKDSLIIFFYKFNEKKGFTLIELLVVVKTIIGILKNAVGVVAYNGYTKSAKR